MNIGIVCYHTVGGSGTVAYELGAFLAKKGTYQVHFIGLYPPFRWDDTIQNIMFHQIETIDYPVFVHKPYTLALASRIAQVAKEYKLQIVHIHYAIPHAVAALLARNMTDHPFKVITTLHGTDINLVGKHHSFFDITKYAIVQSDVVTSVSESLKDQTAEIFGIPSGKIKVIPNFIVKKCSENVIIPPKLDEIASENFILVHASNLRDVKRPHDLIKVAKRIYELGFKDFRLWIIGDGPKREQIEQLSREYNIASHVDFMGTVQVLEKYFKCADIFLLTSELESFGLAALEAMACETAVAGYKVGGLPEVIDNQSGYLVPLYDVEALANRCFELIQNPALLDRKKKDAQKRAHTVYDSEIIIPLYEYLFCEMVSE